MIAAGWGRHLRKIAWSLSKIRAQPVVFLVVDEFRIGEPYLSIRRNRRSREILFLRIVGDPFNRWNRVYPDPPVERRGGLAVRNV